MIEHILEVRIGSEIFGIDSEQIAHILNIPPITPVPVTNSAIKGVCVILGKIISVVDIAKILNLDEVDISNENSKILTISEDSALIVDEVLEMIDINPENLEEAEDEIIDSFYKIDNRIIQILNIPNLISKIETKEFEPKKIEKIAQKEVKETINEELVRYLFFYIGDEEFCIDISLIQEIIFIPEITPTTNPDELGMITLRDKVIPVININKMFGFEPDEITQESRCIIINAGDSFAILVKKVDEVKDINVNDIESIKNDKISGIYKGKSIASIISYDFLNKIVDEREIEEKEIKGVNMVEVVVFKINDEEFAFDINDVQEIIKYENPIFFPQAPKFVKGLLNLRGSVIPIISLPNKLGFEENITDHSKIIVCEIEEEKIGFIVDDVSDILFIEDDKISKIENKDSIFDEVINLDERVILKIDLKSVFSDEEIETIKLTRQNNG